MFEGTSPRTGAPTPRVIVQAARPDEPGRVFTPPAWALKSVTLNGDDITDVPPQISESAKLGARRVVLTDRVTEISGTVDGARDEPLKDYVVVVVHPAEESPAWRRRDTVARRLDQDGRFRIRGLPPGSYLAPAIEALEQGRKWDPEFIRRFRYAAKPFALTEGQTLTLPLTIANIQ